MTTSIKSIPPPSNGVQLTSQKKLPFIPHTFNSSPYDGRGLSLPTTISPHSPFANLNLSQPFASASLQKAVDNSAESFGIFETASFYATDDKYRKCIKHLEKKIKYEEQNISETIKKSKFWKSKSADSYSAQLYTQALLLISKTRLQTYKELVTRIHTLHRMSITAPSISKALWSTCTIYNIRINLCPQYYKDGPNDENYVFLLTFSTGERIVATEIIQDIEGARLRRLRIDEPVHLANLPMVFQIKIDILALQKVTVQKSPRVLAKKGFNFIGHGKQQNGSEDDEMEESAFKSIGHAFLTRENNGRSQFLISSNEYPLDGTMEIKYEVSKLPAILSEEKTGFWNLCHENDIKRFWIKMKNGIIYFYEHPENPEEFIEPNHVIDISTICTRHLEREKFVFKDNKHKFIFYMDIIAFPRGSDLCEHKRYLISLDTEEQLQEWLTKLNSCLEIIREKNAKV